MPVLAKDLRAAVLQAAIQGKLTQQLPEDGDVRYLLAQIKAEKEGFYKQYKLKDDASLSPIEDEDISFDIPSNWEWVKLNDIALKPIKRGKAPSYDQNGTSYAFAQKCNSKYEGIKLDLALALSNVSLKKYAEYDKLIIGDIVINSTGHGTLGRIGYIDETCNITDADYYPDSHVTTVRAVKSVDSSYIMVCLKGYSKLLESFGSGSTNQTELKPAVIQNLLIPLPPLAEQHRIVARVEELMSLIDEYEKIENQLVELKEKFPGDMKAALLQAAMQGKLTKQLSSDSSVDVLISNINNTREIGIKNKSIRKAKGISTYNNDDIPYDIPENWAWMRFGQVVANYDGDRRPVSKENREKSSSTSYPYYGATGQIDEVKDYLFDGEYLMIGEDGGNFFVDRDNSFIANGKFWANNHVHVVKPIHLKIKYLKYFLDSCNLPAMGLISGIAVPKLNQEHLNSLLVPISPIEEQQRIVEILDKLLPMCDELTE